MASGTHSKRMSGLPEKMRKMCVCVCWVMPLVSCSSLPWHFLRSSCSRDGSFQPGSGTLAEAFKRGATVKLSDVNKFASKNKTYAVPGGGLTEFLCMWVKELHTWQKVSQSELSGFGKLAPLQKHLYSLLGQSKWKREKVFDCSRDWFGFVRVVQTGVHICSVPLCSAPPSQASGFLSLDAFPISSSQFVDLKNLAVVHP